MNTQGVLFNLTRPESPLFSEFPTISFEGISEAIQCGRYYYLSSLKGEKRGPKPIKELSGEVLRGAFLEYVSDLFLISGKAADARDFSEYLTKNLAVLYQKEVDTFSGLHYSTPLELLEYHKKAVETFEKLKKLRRQFFNLKRDEYVGHNVQLTIDFGGIYYTYRVDLLLLENGVLKAFFFLTSPYGIEEEMKKSFYFLAPYLLCKKALIDRLKCEDSEVEVSLLVIRTKEREDAMFPVKRIQHIVPTQGKNKLTKVFNYAKEVITKDFIKIAENADEIDQHRTIKCHVCPYRLRWDLCPNQFRSK